MTVLGEARAVYAGGVAAVAVYAGAVKVWPLIPPADTAAEWLVGGVLRFGDQYTEPAGSGSLVADIPTGGTHTDAPQAVAFGPSAISLARVYPGGLTQTQAAALWSGNRVRFTWATIQNALTFTQISVLGPTP